MESEHLTPPSSPNFFSRAWKNKLYVILAFILSFLFLMQQLSPEIQEEKARAKEQTQQVQEKIKNAEISLKQAIEEEGSLEKLLQDDPKKFQLISYFGLFLFAILLLGLWLDGRCLILKLKGQPFMKTLPIIELPKWSVGDIFRVMILFLAFSALLGVLTDFAGRWNPDVFNINGRLILHGTIADLIILALVFFFAQVRHGQSFIQLQMRPSTFWQDAGVGLAAYAAFLPIIVGLLFLLVWIVSLIPYEPAPQKIVEIFIEESKRNPWIVGYGIFLATIIGPIIEEIFFRGFFYSALRKKAAAIPAALITAVFFALLHQSSFAFLPIFILSLVLTYLYEKRKSIVTPIVFHITHNALFLGYFFLMKETFLDKFLH